MTSASATIPSGISDREWLAAHAPAYITATFRLTWCEVAFPGKNPPVLTAEQELDVILAWQFTYADAVLARREQDGEQEQAPETSDLAVIVAALVSGVARWDRLPGDAAGGRGELCFGGARHFTRLHNGVPVLSGEQKTALKAVVAAEFGSGKFL